MLKNCPSCNNAPAIVNPQFGLLPCELCKKRLDNLPKPKMAVEIIPERIKEERKERQDSIEQPHFKGELNKRYIDIYGEDIARKKGFSDKEIRNAKYVYDGTPIRYYKDRT